MGFANRYNLAGLTEEDALMVAKQKLDEAQARLDVAQSERDEWDHVHSGLLAKWVNKHYGEPKNKL